MSQSHGPKQLDAVYDRSGGENAYGILNNVRSEVKFETAVVLPNSLDVACKLFVNGPEVPLELVPLEVDAFW